MAVVTDLLIAAKNGTEAFDYYPIAKDIPININYNLADVREPDKRKASFSKTITLLGSSTVNKLFENIFSVNVATQYFNKNLKTPCKYIVDNIENFKGDLQLIKVNIKPDNSIEYECSIIGEGGSLFVDIGEKLIVGNSDSADDLDFSTYNHVYDRDTQIATRTNAGTGIDVVYPFIDKGSNGGSDTTFNVEDFIPCLAVREYIDKIIAKTGRTFTSNWLDSTDAKNLIVYPNISDIPLSLTQLNNKQFYVGLSANVSIPNNLYIDVAYTNSSTLGFFDLGSQLQPSLDDVILNASGYYNVACQQFVKFKLAHTNPAVAYFRTSTLLVSKIMKSADGGLTYFIVNQQTDLLTSAAAPITALSPINTDLYGSGGCATGSQTFSAGDHLGIKVFCSPQTIQYFDSSHNIISPPPSGTATFTAELISGTGKTSFYALCTQKTVISGDTVEVNSCLPTKIKQKDFFKSIIQAFNLFVDVDPDDENNLIIEPFNEFYNTTNPVDYENKTDLSKEQSINPNVLDGKRYIFSYKEDKDYWNTKYKDEFNEVFGTEQIDVDNDFIKSDKKNELIFSPTPNVANYGLGIAHPRIYQMDSLTKKIISPNIRLLTLGGVKTSQSPYTYKQAGETDLTTYDYLYAGHTDDPFNPTLDINFGFPKRVYYDYPNAYFTSNNLYNVYHKDYLNNLINRDAKFVTKYLWLSPKDIYLFSFRNRLFIDGAYYIVNKIENYNPLAEESTKVELIKLLETDVFVPESFLISSLPSVNGGNDVLSARLNSSMNLGTGIQNRGTNCIAVGNNIVIPESCTNVTVIGDNVSIPENTSDITMINNQVMSSVVNDKGAIKSVSADYNIKAWDDTVAVTTGTTDRTITLAYATTDYIQSDIAYTLQDVDIAYTVTKKVNIKKVDSGSGKVIIDGDGALIDGSSTISLTTQYESVTLQWDGTNWNII